MRKLLVGTDKLWHGPRAHLSCYDLVLLYYHDYKAFLIAALPVLFNCQRWLAWIKIQICTAISSRLMLSMFIYLVSTQHAYIT
jgi:hypothetical protein